MVEPWRHRVSSSTKPTSADIQADAERGGLEHRGLGMPWDSNTAGMLLASSWAASVLPVVAKSDLGGIVQERVAAAMARMRKWED